MTAFNPPIKGTSGNWDTGTDATSLIKPKKQLAMGPMKRPIAMPNGRQGLPKDTGKIGRQLSGINMSPNGSKP